NPVASGSRVPPWPALRASKMRRTALTARVEVMPRGLSRMTQPWRSRPVFLRAMDACSASIRFRVGIGQIAGHARVMKQALHRVGIIEGGVQTKVHIRHEFQLDLAGQLAANEASGALQRLEYLF